MKNPYNKNAILMSVSLTCHAPKEGFVALWLRHTPAPLLWNHPIAKKHILMPKRHSNMLFALKVFQTSAQVRSGFSNYFAVSTV